jgi:hypothetical protein
MRSDEISKDLEKVVADRAVVFDPVLLAAGHRYLRSWRESDDPGVSTPNHAKGSNLYLQGHSFGER